MRIAFPFQLLVQIVIDQPVAITRFTLRGVVRCDSR